MAKRMTDTNKWDKDFFVSLSFKHKLFWLYLCDKCDCAGIWDMNWSVASRDLGAPFSVDDLDAFNGKIERVKDNRIWINSFVRHQYGDRLNPKNNVHKTVINILKKYSIEYPTIEFQVNFENEQNQTHKEPLPSPFARAKDKDKDSIGFKSFLNQAGNQFGKEFHLAQEKQRQEDKQKIDDLRLTALETLATLGVKKENLSKQEDAHLINGVKQHGIEQAKKALVGMRYEKGTSTWSPRDNPDIGRAFGDRHDKLVNLGERHDQKNKTPSAAPASPYDFEYDPIKDRPTWNTSK